jgi:hypothetical protein
MKETFRTVHAGERPSAKDYNRLRNRVAEEANAGALYGAQEVDIGGVRGTARTPQSILMVRLQTIIIPESSLLFEESLETAVDADGSTGGNAYNGIIQIWDADAKRWADDPDHNQVVVAVLDDAEGWRPLLRDAIIPVYWRKTPGVYVPLETQEAAIVMITSSVPDDGGFYPGLILGYDSDTETWISKGDCFVVDVGN